MIGCDAFEVVFTASGTEAIIWPFWGLLGGKPTHSRVIH